MSDPYLDAQGEVERREGEKAIKKIQGTRDWDQYRRESEYRAEAALQAYEGSYRRIQRGIQQKRGTLRTQAMQAKQEGRDIEAGVKYGASVGVAAVGGTFEGLTAPLRPYNLPAGMRNTKEVLTDPAKRSAAIKEFKADVAGGLATGAGAVLGGSLAGKVIGRVRGKPQAKARTKYEIEEQLPFETELGEQYPQTVDTYRTEYRGFEPTSGGVIVDDSFMSSKLMPKGKYPSGKRAYIRTGSDLVPVQVAQDTKLMPVYKPIIDVETSTSYLPGLRNLPFPIERYKTYSGLGLYGVTGLSNIQKTNISNILKSRETPISQTSSRARQIELSKIRQNPIFNISFDLKSSVFGTIKQAPTQKERTASISTIRQAPIQQIQQSPLQAPTPAPIPIIRTSGVSRSPLQFRETRSPRTRKKGKRKRKGVAELRVDPVKSLKDVLKL